MALNTPQKFTETELKVIRDLQLKIQQVTNTAGQLFLAKLKLKKQEDEVNKQLSTIEKEEKTIADKLTKKYGKGSLDIESGEFTPIQ